MVDKNFIWGLHTALGQANVLLSILPRSFLHRDANALIFVLAISGKVIHGSGNIIALQRTLLKQQPTVAVMSNEIVSGSSLS